MFSLFLTKFYIRSKAFLKSIEANHHNAEFYAKLGGLEALEYILPDMISHFTFEADDYDEHIQQRLSHYRLPLSDEQFIANFLDADTFNEILTEFYNDEMLTLNLDNQNESKHFPEHLHDEKLGIGYDEDVDSFLYEDYLYKQFLEKDKIFNIKINKDILELQHYPFLDILDYSLPNLSVTLQQKFFNKGIAGRYYIITSLQYKKQYLRELIRYVVFIREQQAWSNSMRVSFFSALLKLIKLERTSYIFKFPFLQNYIIANSTCYYL